VRSDLRSEGRTNAELPDKCWPLRSCDVDDYEPMAAVRKIGEISHPYRRPVDSEWRIARRMPPQRLIRHAEASELARSLGLAHIEEHQDEPHLSGDSSAQMKEPEIVESVAVRPSVAGLEVTQLSGVRRIRDVPDEHPFGERRPELSAPVWRDRFE
jgi:hypothetical protein